MTSKQNKVSIATAFVKITHHLSWKKSLILDNKCTSSIFAIFSFFLFASFFDGFVDNSQF